jgi:hypothetical protein
MGEYLAVLFLSTEQTDKMETNSIVPCLKISHTQALLGVLHSKYNIGIDRSRNIHAAFKQKELYGAYIQKQASGLPLVHVTHKAVTVPVIVVIPFATFAAFDPVRVS